MQLPTIRDAGELRGKRVLVRSSLNVPLKNGEVTSDFRIRRSLPTIEYLIKAGARVVVAGHIGREPNESLRPVYETFQKHLDLSWCDAPIGPEVKTAVDALGDGEVLMLENLRKYPGEKANDESFAQDLASLGDIYVNDAFSASHREHASIVGVPRFLPHYAGITFSEEFEELQKAMKPESPALFILGGAKFETKLPLIEQYADVYDNVFIGGALANDIWRARDLEVGRSVVSDIDLSATPLVHDERLILPVDVTVQEGKLVRITTPNEVKKTEIIYDAGPKTIELLTPIIHAAKTILWNGPLGYFEGGFSEYTKQCAEVIARSTAHSVVGGGDSVAAIEMLGLQTEFDFISTAGGAMLVFLEKGTLPGIEALKTAD